LLSARILIVGAGALGSLYGGFLRRAGHEVTLIGRAAHLDAIRSRGLTIEGVFGRAQVGGFSLAVSAAQVAGPFDLIVLAVKSYDVASAVGRLVTALADDGAVLALQNGLGHLEILAERFGAGCVLAAPVLIGATIPTPGAVRVTVYVKPVKIGAPWADDRRAKRWTAVLADAGLPSEPTERPMPFLWEKMLYNLPLNALGAVLRLPYGALAERPESRWIMDHVIEEGFAIARADGAELLWNSAAECRRHFYEVLLPPTVAHRSSMLQDIERGRRTEIDVINGYVCRRGEARAIPTPYNRVLAALVHTIEERREGSGFPR
jgi:2-dehydropantoate 2-reductase